MKAPAARNRASRNSFTLVEMLVVVGIIAILGTLSVAGFDYALDKARSAACTSNLRQIYVALQTYAGDHDQQLPVMLPMRASLGDPGPTLDTELSNYISDPAVFHCPADPTIYRQSGDSYWWIYGMSVNSSGEQNQSLVGLSFPLLQTAASSQIPFISDKESFHHSKPGSHIIYADGHVQ